MQPQPTNLSSIESRVGAQRLMPRKRPCYPMLTIMDDGRCDSGEVIRIRREALSIGRSSGDLQFPAECLMSASHASIVLKEISKDVWQWVLLDQNSLNGVFVRVTDTMVFPGNELLVGSTKLQLLSDQCHPVIYGGDANLIPYVSQEQINDASWRFSGYCTRRTAKLIPANHRNFYVGTGVPSPGNILGDSFVDAQHLSLKACTPNSWKAVDLDSVNGLWIRVQRIVLTANTTFMLGEQRFHFTIPDSGWPTQ